MTEWYKEYKNNIVENQRVETYFKNSRGTQTFLDKYYRIEWNNRNILSKNNDKKDEILGKINKLINKLEKQEEYIYYSLFQRDMPKIFDSAKKIKFWTKIFNISYFRKAIKNNKKELKSQDYFWLILSSVNFMNEFGSSTNSGDKFHRSYIIKAFQDFLDSIKKDPKEFGLEGRRKEIVEAFDQKSFFEALLKDNSEKVEIDNVTYYFGKFNNKTGEKKLRITIMNKDQPDRIIDTTVTFTSETNKTISELLKDEAAKNFKQEIKRLSREKGYGNIIFQLPKSPVTILEMKKDNNEQDEKTRGNKFLTATMDLSEKIKKVADKKIKEGEVDIEKFTTASNKTITNYALWYYKTLKHKLYENYPKAKKIAFLKLKEEIEKIEKELFSIFCNAIKDSIESLREKADENSGELELELGYMNKIFKIHKNNIEQAINFIKSGRAIIWKIMRQSESIHILGDLYSYQAQLGAIGELLAIKNFSLKDIVVKSQGQTHDIGISEKYGNEEKKINFLESFQDVSVMIDDLKFGINVKHFLSDQQSGINLYNNKDKNTWNLNSKFLFKYMSEKDWEDINYLNINSPYFNNNETEKEINEILQKYIPEFLRMIGSPLLKNESVNVFYQLNNMIIPSTVLLKEIKTKIENKGKFFILSGINNKVYTYQDIKNNNLITKCLSWKTGTKVTFTGIKYEIPKGV